jgi:hypothetical protein
MASSTEERPGILRLIAVPSLITLAVTILRVVGERNQWAPAFFSPKAGGAGALVGISWLVPVFGIWFALRLSRAGDGPARPGRLLVVTAALIAGTIAAGYVFNGLLKLGFPMGAFFTFLVAVGAMLFLAPQWPSLWKTLLAYGLAARIPVVVVMFFAMQGDWHTHYDALPPEVAGSSLASNWFQFGVIPQLTLWIAFTEFVGFFLGGAAVALFRRRTVLATS